MGNKHTQTITPVYWKFPCHQLSSFLSSDPTVVGGAIYSGSAERAMLLCLDTMLIRERQGKVTQGSKDFREASVQHRKSNDRENPRLSGTEASMIVGTPFQKKNIKVQKFGVSKCQFRMIK